MPNSTDEGSSRFYSHQQFSTARSFSKLGLVGSVAGLSVLLNFNPIPNVDSVDTFAALNPLSLVSPAKAAAQKAQAKVNAGKTNVKTHSALVSKASVSAASKANGRTMRVEKSAFQSPTVRPKVAPRSRVSATRQQQAAMLQQEKTYRNVKPWWQAASPIAKEQRGYNQHYGSVYKPISAASAPKPKMMRTIRWAKK